MNPNLTARRFADPDRPQDLKALWQHYHWMQTLGVRWFNLSLDDIGDGTEAATQARLVNEIFRRLRAADPEAQMIFCPTYYWGDGTPREAEAYLKVLAASLHSDLYVFWTGDEVITPRITRRAAESYRRLVAHRLFLWDNYPVNDNHPTLHLGPLRGRDADLCEVIDGYLSNSMSPQDEINRLPMFTCADYAWNPWGYDPARSSGQAIVHLAQTAPQRAALKDLVEAYPGMLLFAQPTLFNPVRARLAWYAEQEDGRSRVAAYLRETEALARRFRAAFPRQFSDAKQTLDDDLTWLNAEFRKEEPQP
jgi:hyaluronoglucosaminidase